MTFSCRSLTLTPSETIATVNGRTTAMPISSDKVSYESDDLRVAIYISEQVFIVGVNCTAKR